MKLARGAGGGLFESDHPDKDRKAVLKVKSINRKGRNPEQSGYAKNTKIFISAF